MGPLGRAQASRGLGRGRGCGRHLDAAEVDETLDRVRQPRLLGSYVR
jgi:hypothetical protein